MRCDVLFLNSYLVPGFILLCPLLIIFSRVIVYFCFSPAQPSLSRALMMVMSDLDEPFIPTPDHIFANLKDSLDVITQLLKDIPNMFAKVAL